MTAGLFIGGKQAFRSKRSMETGQSFLFGAPARFALISLVKKQRDAVVPNVNQIGIAVFHTLKPLLGENALLFQIIDKVIHGMLEG